MIQVILKERDKVDLEKMLFSVPSQLWGTLIQR